MQEREKELVELNKRQQAEIDKLIEREKIIRFHLTNIEQNEPINMALNAEFIEKLGELVSKEDRKTIPLFKGGVSDSKLSEFDWIKEAERIARSNNWTDSHKIRFFGDRLKGDAADWHSEYLEKYPQRITILIGKNH